MTWAVSSTGRNRRSAPSDSPDETPSGTPINMARATATNMIANVIIVRSQKPKSPTANIDAAAIGAVRQPARNSPITKTRATTPVQCSARSSDRTRFTHQPMADCRST